jgi:hypothetical protein
LIEPAAFAITQQAAAAASEAGGGPSWWDVTSGLLLTASAAWASWAQWIYPKLAERKARAAGATTTPPPAIAATPPAPPVDIVGEFFRDQSQRLDDVTDELALANRQRIKDAVAIARLVAERDTLRREACPDPACHRQGAPA